MALEDLTGTSKFINSLVKTNPIGASDLISEGDDHLRGVKNVLLNTFPNLNAAVTRTPQALNTIYVKGADVASATALALSSDGDYFDVTGVVTITSIDTVAVGTEVTLHFDSTVTLTHHATDLILPTNANITTQAGDEAKFREYAAGDWRCVSYLRNDGTALGDTDYLAYDIGFTAGYASDGTEESVAVQEYGHIIAVRAFTLSGVEAYAETAPTGAAMQFDIKKNGVTVFSTAPEIDAAANADDGNHVLSVTAVAAGDRLSFEVTQVGSTIAGSGVMFSLKGTL